MAIEGFDYFFHLLSRVVQFSWNALCLEGWAPGSLLGLPWLWPRQWFKGAYIVLAVSSRSTCATRVLRWGSFRKVLREALRAPIFFVRRL